MLKYLGLLVISFFYSCGSAVYVDFDPDTNYNNYTTYNYYPSISSGLSDFDDKRVIFALDSLLPQKGIIKSDNPQFLINFYANQTISNSGSTIGIGMGSGGINGGFGVSGGIPISSNKIKQEFTLDFIDAATDQLIWQGVINKSINIKTTPTQRDKYYLNLIEKELQNFPPPQKE